MIIKAYNSPLKFTSSLLSVKHSPLKFAITYGQLEVWNKPIYADTIKFDQSFWCCLTILGDQGGKDCIYTKGLY